MSDCPEDIENNNVVSTMHPKHSTLLDTSPGSAFIIYFSQDLKGSTPKAFEVWFLTP